MKREERSGSRPARIDFWVPILVFVAVLGVAGVHASVADEPTVAATPLPSFKDALAPFVESGAAPGAVVVVGTPTEELALETIGWSDVASQTPMAPDSYFWIASNSKAIVAAATMICVDEGKLDLDVPIETYLPELADLKVGRAQDDGSIALTAPKTKPTLRQALSHTAGFPFITPYQQKYGIDALPARRLTKVVSTTPLIDEPGARYSYSNLGIDVAQAAVEAVSGVPFEEFLQTRIFDPLGMTDATFYPNEEQTKRMATVYAWDGEANGGAGALKPVRFNQMPSLDDGSPRYAEGGGGLFATARDLFNFYRMLGAKGVAPDGRRILSEKAVETMTTKQTPENVDAQYGFGLTVDDRQFEHGGAYGTLAFAYRDGSFVAVYMVAIAVLPCQDKMENAFRKTAAEFAERLGERK